MMKNAISCLFAIMIVGALTSCGDKDPYKRKLVETSSLVGKVKVAGELEMNPMRGVNDGKVECGDKVFVSINSGIPCAKVWIGGFSDRFVYTNAQGKFEFFGIPVGENTIFIRHDVLADKQFTIEIDKDAGCIRVLSVFFSNKNKATHNPSSICS